MKNLFPEYEISGSLDYAAIWKEALFVFDTNVLLNLYRYRIGTRDELLALLEQIAERTWIPYHVALEFQRNRLSVIAEQIKRFTDVKQTVEKASSNLNNELAKYKLNERHSSINTEPLLTGLENLTREFFAQLENLKKDQQTISGPDSIKTQLEVLFDGRVGPKIEKQDILDSFQKEAGERFRLRIPPGYEDDIKDNKESDEFVHSGLVYKKKYGDFIIWKQMLTYCREKGKKSLIFVTDDTKEDWWHVIELNGPKTIGPRAELIDEARREGLVEHFLMYTPSNFLNYAKETLKVDVSEEAIQEVKELTVELPPPRKQTIEIAFRARVLLSEWLLDKYGSVADGPHGLIAEPDGDRYIHVIAIAHQPKQLSDFYTQTEQLASNIRFNPVERHHGHIVVVWIAVNRAQALSIRTGLVFSKKRANNFELGIDVIIATLDNPETQSPGFFVHCEMKI